MKNVPIEEVIERTTELGLEWEQDKAWVWITTDLSPVHRKCECVECEARKAVRKMIGKDGIGYIFGPSGHTLPSGKVSHWGHHCESPIRFKRRSKGASPEETTSTTETVSDDQLLAMLS